MILSIVVLIATAVFVFTGTGDKFLFGYKPFVIATGSMEPEYSTHCIVVVRQDAYEDVQVGDVVAFLPQQLGGSGAMHRVIEKTSEGYITKGDNNDFADDGYVISDNYVGRAIWHTNAMAGYIDKLMQPNGLILFLAIPLAGIVLLLLALKLILPARGKSNQASVEPLSEEDSGKEGADNQNEDEN